MLSFSMKKTITITLTLFSLSFTAFPQQISGKMLAGDANGFEDHKPIAYATPRKDTLYLLESDPISKMIEKVWKEHPCPEIYGKAPVIVFVKTLPNYFLPKKKTSVKITQQKKS